jgi:hypothetical protein
MRRTQQRTIGSRFFQVLQQGQLSFDFPGLFLQSFANRQFSRQLRASAMMLPCTS